MFYAFYKSVNPADNINFITPPHSELAFPTQVMYKNKPCRLVQTYQVSTPKQQAHFAKFLETQLCERDIKVV